MRHGARFLAALNSGDETPGDVDYTSLFSDSDELVQPPSSARLDGAVNTLVQDLCPGRPVHHGGIVHDPMIYALVIDALEHEGPADPARVDRGACHSAWMPGMTEPFTGNAMLYSNAFAALLAHGTVSTEPPLAAYAR